MKKLRAIFLVIPFICGCINVFAGSVTNMSESSNGGVVSQTLTLATVVNTLDERGYDNIQMIKKKSDDAYIVQASKNGDGAELFFLNADGTITMITPNMHVITSAWSPRDVQEANDAYIAAVNHAPIYFGVDTNNKATLSDNPSRTGRAGTILDYNKETNTVTKVL